MKRASGLVLLLLAAAGCGRERQLPTVGLSLRVAGMVKAQGIT